MTDAALKPGYLLGAVACGGLVCLLVVSGVVLAIVLYRRSRKNG